MNERMMTKAVFRGTLRAGLLLLILYFAGQYAWVTLTALRISEAIRP